MFGLLLGFAGLVLLFGVDLTGGTQALLGGLLLVGSALCYACGALLIHNKLTFAEPLGIATVAMLASVATLIVPGLTLNYSLIQHAGPARATLAFYLSPAVAVVLSWLLLGERISWSSSLGLIAIVAGSALAANRVRLE